MLVEVQLVNLGTEVSSKQEKRQSSYRPVLLASELRTESLSQTKHSMSRGNWYLLIYASPKYQRVAWSEGMFPKFRIQFHGELSTKQCLSKVRPLDNGTGTGGTGSTGTGSTGTGGTGGTGTGGYLSFLHRIHVVDRAVCFSFFLIAQARRSISESLLPRQ